jgi:uncharacterized protein (TIGR00159 family)
MDFIPFSFIDLIDIVLVALFMFGIYRMSRGTNAPYIFTGIIVIYFVWVVVRALNMELLQAILGQLVSVGVIALIILFQPEIRNFLQAIGRRQGAFKFINNIFNNRNDNESSLQPIITACSEMSATKTGALMVILRQTKLGEVITTGTPVDAQISSQLLGNLFFPKSPLHDGAVIIDGNRVVAAACYLPLTDDRSLSKELGTRHRAGIGISETADCVVVIVSEETGKISLALNGNLTRNLSPESLKKWLEKLLSPQTGKSISGKKIIGKVRNSWKKD